VNNNRPYTFSRKKKRLLISYTCPDFRDCYGINIDYISAGHSKKKMEDRVYISDLGLGISDWRGHRA